MLKTEELSLFVAIIEAQSITAAAEKLGLPKSNVSRRLKQLEQSLQVKLIERNSRLFKPTQAGITFYQGAIDILQRTHQLDSQMSQQQNQLSGLLRISSSSALIHLMLPSCINEFSQRYPNIQLEFITGSYKRSLLEDSIDLQLTIDRSKDSSLIATPIMKVKSHFYASPQYLLQHSTPDTPEQLSQHQRIGCLKQGLEKIAWRYFSEGKYQFLNLSFNHSSDSAAICREMVELGMGIAQLPEFVCADAVKRGQLVPLFDDSMAFVVDIYAVYSSRDLLPMKTRVLVDFLKQYYLKIIQ
jgi:DNA-binding transcriptional LysR family regulator